jgi:hypothetical protein
MQVDRTSMYVVKSTHQILTTSKVASVIKKTAREEYATCKQGPFEHIVDYKRKFDIRLDALKVSRNADPLDEDVAMDFIYGLDNSRYAEFKAEIVNDLMKGTLTPIKYLNKMYILTSWREVEKESKEAPGGATFATVDQQINLKKSPKGKDNEEKDTLSKEEKYAQRLAKMKCFNCGKKGHLARACPELEEESCGDDLEPPMAGMMMQVCCALGCPPKRLYEFYEVCLDSGSQVNIVDPRLLMNLTTSQRMYHSMNGSASTTQVGYLDGFFDCQACTDCPVNIISMSYVEDRYPMMWVQGESITVHMDKADLVFYRRDKMWVADFSEWIISEEDHAQELCAQLNLMTVSEKEDLYTRKDVLRALEAGEFLKSLGYPTQREAIGLVRDGNVRNVPHTVEDVKRFFDIYGP